MSKTAHTPDFAVKTQKSLCSKLTLNLGYVLGMFLKFGLISASTDVLIKKDSLYKKDSAPFHLQLINMDILVAVLI